MDGYIGFMSGRESRFIPICHSFFPNVTPCQSGHCQNYREATQAVVPHASLVVDKFHITRMANESMAVVQKGLKNSLTAPQRRTLKGDRKAMLTRKHDLNDWQHLTMETWLNAFPELKTAYDLNEEETASPVAVRRHGAHDLQLDGY
jgi:transposase